jgi:hypothetical protein
VFKVLQIEVEDYKEVSIDNLLEWGALDKLEVRSTVLPALHTTPGFKASSGKTAACLDQ